MAMETRRYLIEECQAGVKYRLETFNKLDVKLKHVDVNDDVRHLGKVYDKDE